MNHENLKNEQVYTTVIKICDYLQNNSEGINWALVNTKKAISDTDISNVSKIISNSKFPLLFLPSVYSGKNYLFNQSGVDVTVNPFASSITEKGVANTVTFVENSGYTVPVLNSLLYVLAATEPGTLYFGAIRGADRTVSPEIMAFNECVAFFPYFQDDGSFACAVFMNGREMSLENFLYYYYEDFVYLTRVKSSERFYPN